MFLWKGFEYNNIKQKYTSNHKTYWMWKKESYKNTFPFSITWRIYSQFEQSFWFWIELSLYHWKCYSENHIKNKLSKHLP